MSFLIDYNVHFSEKEVLANGQEEIKDHFLYQLFDIDSKY